MLETVAWIRPRPWAFFLLQVAFEAAYASIAACVAFAAGGEGLVNKSLAGGVEPGMRSPLITSHMSRIRVVDWIWSSHNPKFGPSSVGMRNLLMSIFVYSFCVCVRVGFLYEMGLHYYKNRCQELLVVWFFSAGRGLH